MRAWIVIVVAVLLLPGVAANDVVMPPMDLRGEVEDGFVVLTWNAPEGAAVDAVYRVYQNGSLIAETTQTEYEAALSDGLDVFYVTMLDGVEESLPSEPLFVQQGGGSDGESVTDWFSGPNLPENPLLDEECGIVSVRSYEHWPFVSVAIHEWCIPIIGPYIVIPPIPLVAAESVFW